LPLGEVAERLKAALLKSAESKDFVGSNPTLSANRITLQGTVVTDQTRRRAPDRVQAQGAGPAPGLCAGCRHSRQIRTSRGTVFRLCERSVIDVRYRRYPALPVLDCPGFEPRPQA
jgi:hypothetical protein